MPWLYSTRSNPKIKTFFLANVTFRLGTVIWPEKMSYIAWQKLVRKCCWFLGKTGNGHPCKRKKKIKKTTCKYRILLQEKRRLDNERTQKQLAENLRKLEAFKSASNGDIKLELITMLKLFWERKHVSKHIEQAIPDYRNQDLITYSKQSIMMSALAIFLFRMGSGNNYDNRGHDTDEKYSKANIAKFIESPEGRVPVIKTIEKFLKNLEVDGINDLMITFFKDLQQSKFFRQHPKIIPGDFFLLAADCVHTHTYDHPHHVDIDGNHDCPYCLKRVYNKGTKGETVRWVHNTLVFSFVFMGGLKIPIYYYPIHAKKIANLESACEDTHKQECETVALKIALPAIRQAFPRMKIALLLDGLYANKPVIRLIKKCRCEYIIVRKDGCLSLLAKDCDEQSARSTHKKNCVKECKKMDEGWLIVTKYAWFNSRYLGDEVTTNVLRFSETRTKEEERKSYKCEWLFSWRLSAKTCELASRQARARWEVEDLFNTCKNRGYNFRHDYSRSPLSCFIWQGLGLFAFGIFELFRFSEAVKQRCDFPQETLAQKLLGQLLYRSTEEIFSKNSLSKQIQFRYHFVVKSTIPIEVRQGSTDEWFNTS